MNLHSIASGAIGAINPHQKASVIVQSGYQTLPSGKTVPKHSEPVEVLLQRQELSQKDLAHIAGLNVQGQLCAVYLNGQHSGIVRPDGKGGEQFTLADGTVWKVIAVPEQWPDWSKVILCRQT
ncbi:hypothetical protein [Zymobacter sp. IVIA_12111.31 C1]|uniref:hypothetical protein n=1 Tax=Zymobacter sp. IVIA_12111.31 C1 TaxID=3394854 RepID=UPI0039C421AF